MRSRFTDYGQWLTDVKVKINSILFLLLYWERPLSREHFWCTSKAVGVYWLSLIFAADHEEEIPITVLEIMKWRLRAAKNLPKCIWCDVLSCSIMPTLWEPTRLLCPWDSPGKNTGVCCHFLLQRTFLTQLSNPHLLRLLDCKWILYHWAIGEA